jgi:hypothetical protein
MISIFWNFWLRRYLNTSVYSAPINDLEALPQQTMNVCREIREKFGIFTECAPLPDEELIVVLK